MTQRTTIPTNLSPTLRRTLELVRDDSRTQVKLCTDAGVHTRCIPTWRTRGAATLGGLEAVLGAMGYRLEVVPIDARRSPRLLARAAAALLSRDDFWSAVHRAGIGVPGEYDDLADIVATQRRDPKAGFDTDVGHKVRQPPDTLSAFLSSEIQDE